MQKVRRETSDSNCGYQFNVLLNVHHAMILGNCPTWRTNSFQCIYLFIVLYMFRACHAHHQEKQIISIQLLVIVTPCWWQCRVLVGGKPPTKLDNYQESTNFESRVSVIRTELWTTVLRSPVFYGWYLLFCSVEIFGQCIYMLCFYSVC